MMDILALLTAYLIGSVPFGLLLTRAAGLPDIRTLGSGNIGATNVLRTGRRGLAVATLLLDMLKGVVAVIAAGAMDEGGIIAMFAACAAVAGHSYPIWLRFQGGKGVATMFGAVFATSPLIGVAGALVWTSVFLFTRISSLSALAAVISMPLIALLGAEWMESIAILPVALLVVHRHRPNIARLIQGNEPKITRHTLGGTSA